MTLDDAVAFTTFEMCRPVKHISFTKQEIDDKEVAVLFYRVEYDTNFGKGKIIEHRMNIFVDEVLKAGISL